MHWLTQLPQDDGTAPGHGLVWRSQVGLDFTLDAASYSTLTLGDSTSALGLQITQPASGGDSNT